MVAVGVCAACRAGGRIIPVDETVTVVVNVVITMLTSHRVDVEASVVAVGATAQS